MIRKFKNHYFVIFDVLMKLFGLFFTLFANYYLAKSDFNELSYFRNTLTMTVGLVTTGLSFYILNFYQTSKKNSKDRDIYFITIIFSLTFGTIISLLSIYIFHTQLHLDHLLEKYDILIYVLVILAIFSQAMIYILKVTKCLDRIVFRFVLTTTLCVVFSFFSMSDGNVLNAYITLCLFYSLNSILFIYAIKDKIKLANEIKMVYPIDYRFKNFLIPSYLESFLSVPRSWLTIYIFSTFVGFMYVGDILIILMILNLFVFVIQSLVMNEFDRIDITSLNSRNKYLSEINNKIDFLLIIYVVVIVFLLDYVKNILKLDQITDVSILMLCIATLIQVKILPVGIIFKRVGAAKDSFKQNALFSILLVTSSLFFIKILGSVGFGISYVFSWVITLVYIFWSVKKDQWFSLSKTIFTLLFLSLILVGRVLTL